MHGFKVAGAAQHGVQGALQYQLVLLVVHFFAVESVTEAETDGLAVHVDRFGAAHEIDQALALLPHFLHVLGPDGTDIFEGSYGRSGGWRVAGGKLLNGDGCFFVGGYGLAQLYGFGFGCFWAPTYAGNRESGRLWA